MSDVDGTRSNYEDWEDDWPEDLPDDDRDERSWSHSLDDVEWVDRP